MDVLPAHIAVAVQAEKYFELSLRDYLSDLVQFPGEMRLSEKQALYIGVAAIMLVVLDRMLVFSKDAFEEIETVLPALIDLPFVAKKDLPKILRTFRKMLKYKIIRADHPLEDWIAEMAWWAAFDSYEYPKVSALLRFIDRLLQGRHVMDQFIVKCD